MRDRDAGSSIRDSRSGIGDARSEDPGFQTAKTPRMKLGVFHTTTANPWGGTYTIKEDIFRGLLTAIDGSGHELVVFSDDVAARSRFPSAGVAWVPVDGLRRRAW